jgi:hypothetical protein
MDKSPYLNVDALDPQWLRVIGHAEAEPKPEQKPEPAKEPELTKEPELPKEPELTKEEATAFAAGF